MHWPLSRKRRVAIESEAQYSLEKCLFSIERLFSLFQSVTTYRGDNQIDHIACDWTLCW